MSGSPQYTGYFSPVYKVQLVEEAATPSNPRATRPIDLTDVSTSDGFELIMQKSNALDNTLGDFQHGIGTWEIIDAENGEAAYQWTAGDLAIPGRYFVYVTVQLPGEPSPRAFDHDTIRIIPLEKGGAAVATQDVNILEINGQIVSSAHPLPITGPVQVADGGDVTKGAKADDAITDHTLSATEIALLKGIVKTMVTDGVKLVQSNVQSDYDTGAGTQTTTMFGIAIPGSGGAVPGGTSTNPLRTDPSGTTTQPVSASSLPLPTGAAREAGGNLDSIAFDVDATATSTANINTAFGSQTSPAVTNPATDGPFMSFIRGILTQLGFGQKTKNNSLSVTLASDQGNIPVSGSVLVNTISGYATENGNLASAKADLDTLAGIVSGGKGAVKAGANDIVDLATLAGIVSSGKAATKAGAGDFVDLATLAGIVSGGKGAVKSGAGDLVDLAALLALAGAAGDANSVNSFMGRLTKIRDLLNATLTVQGTITEANSAATKADLDTIVTNTNKIPGSPATEGGHLATIDTSTAALNTLAGASGDANTVASFMGRLTKIRDLLLGFVFDNTDRLKTSLYVKTSAAADTILTLGRTTKAGSLPVTMASDQDNINVAVNAALPAGTAVIGSTTIQATSGTALSADQSNTELRVSNYVKTTTAGDTALTLGQTTKANSLPVTFASDQAEPVNVGTPTGSTVSVGTGSTAVVTPGASAKFLLLTNDSPNTIYLNISGSPAALNAGVRLNANGGAILFDRYIPSAAITAISSVASSNLLAEVG